MNIALWLERAARRCGDLPAVARGGSVVLTYGSMGRRCAGLASAIRRWNLKVGDHVAVVARNHVSYVETLFAIWWAGLVAVPINAKLHPKEIAWILENASARAVFVSADLEAELGALELSKVTELVAFGSETYEALTRLEPDAVAPRAAEDLAWLFYTSGTTGRPKGAMLSHRNLIAMSLAHLTDVDPTRRGDVLIHCAPLSHGSGLLCPPHVAQMGINVVPESGAFDAAEMIGLVERWRNASFFAPPTIVRRLVDAAADLDETAFRTIVWGGAPMHVADTIAALDRFGPCLAQIYGQGETPMTITALNKEDVGNRAADNWAERLASAGTARSVVEVRVADTGDDPVGPGEPGEVLVRGDTVMPGYWLQPEASEATLRNGWLHTGDIGVLDAEGYLTLKDRSKDVIISGGANIYPREVEEVLVSHPAVGEVSVIGRPDAEWGEIVVAYVVGTATSAELDELCLEHMGRFKRPKDYVFMSALPKSNNGKILKTELRELDARRHSAGTSEAAEIRR